MNLEIRPALPHDADAAAPLVYSSGPACFDYVFSHRTRMHARDYLRRALAKKPGEFGFGIHIVAVVDGEIVGTGAAFSGRDSLQFAISALRGIIANYGLAAAPAIVRRGLQVESVVRPPERDLHYIAHLGVAPGLRGHGIGTGLVEWLLDQGRELGRTTAALDVSEENPRAQALYERLGFRVTRDRISGFSNETARVPNHRRMERSL